MGDYFGVPNMANIPNPSEWKHADTAKAWAEKANNAEAHVEAMVEGLETGLDAINSNLARVNTRLEEVSGEIESRATSASESATSASASATSAAASASSASISATNAATSATSASTSASSAESAKATVQAAVLDAISAKNTAVSSATTATTAATSASTSATSASESADTAQLYATNAAATAQTVNAAVEEAEEYAEAAESAAARAQARYVDADNSATAAQASANAAAATAANVTQYVQASSASATQAETAASNANTYKTAAAGSATTASTAATTATTKASEASESADDAAESATASAASATAAGNSATSAATSATSASSSATNASNSATAAASSASDAEDAATRAETAAEIAEVHIEDNLTSDNSSHVLSAKQGKVLNDLFSGTIHRDHRVRVHINLPYKDHVNDNDGFDHIGPRQDEYGNDLFQLGFSGANLCPDSDYQYASVNRYAGITGDYIYNRFLGANVSCTARSSTTTDLTKYYYNASPGKTNWFSTTGTSAVGRIHTGWASYIIPGCLSLFNPNHAANKYFNSFSENIGNGQGTYVSIPYTKTFVPACNDITEDAVPYLDRLDAKFRSSTLSNLSILNSYYNDYTAISDRFGRYDKTIDFATNIDSNCANTIKYVLPYVMNKWSGDTSTVIKNPRMTLYAGLSFWLDTAGVLSTSQESGSNFINATTGITSPGFKSMRLSHVSPELDAYNLGPKNHWHDNPILPYSPVISNPNRTYNNLANNASDPSLSDTVELAKRSTFFRRFQPLSGTSTTYDRSSPHMVLGIRYFDATAQEWRVFSPGDNCSYGYDGTHWNYREYLWVDLDKPVTYIVGGLATNNSGSSGAKVDYSAYQAMGMTGIYSPYMVDTYESACQSGWSVGTNKCDLIHVETPNYDNHTSYNYWRRMTLMTVDYSSSPLNYTNTLYCADSSYGAEDTGVLDMTKVSCMYTPQSSLIPGLTFSDSTKNKSFLTDNGLDYDMGSEIGTSAAVYTTRNKLLDSQWLMAAHSQYASNYDHNVPINGTEHSAYHIRIGLES